MHFSYSHFTKKETDTILEDKAHEDFTLCGYNSRP